MSEPYKTLAQFSKERGLITTADVDAHIHAGLRSKPQTKTYDRWNARELKRLQDARDETVRLYLAQIGTPPVMTRREQLKIAASGHPDNLATQAAIRLLAKLP